MKLFNQQAKEIVEDTYADELEKIANEGPIFVDEKDEEELSDFSYIDNYDTFIYNIDR